MIIIPEWEVTLEKMFEAASKRKYDLWHRKYGHNKQGA